MWRPLARRSGRLAVAVTVRGRALVRLEACFGTPARHPGGSAVRRTLSRVQPLLLVVLLGLVPSQAASAPRGSSADAAAAQAQLGATRHPAATVREFKKTIRTYPFADPNPIAVFERIYPYFRYDRYTNQPVDREWTVVELENAYLRVQVLPEIGGKIWTAIEKATGRAFIYDNHVVK